MSVIGSFAHPSGRKLQRDSYPVCVELPDESHETCLSRASRRCSTEGYGTDRTTQRNGSYDPTPVAICVTTSTGGHTSGGHDCPTRHGTEIASTARPARVAVVAVGSLDMSTERWFGEPSDVDSKAERHSGAASDAEIDRVFDGHEALDRCSLGKYAEFLRSASRCTRCAQDHKIPSGQQPIPLLCGTLGDREKYHDAHRALEVYRRSGGRSDGSLRVNPANGVKPLAEFLDAHQLSGLSVGHCGWADLTARLRGEQLSKGVDVMVLGADWYPITACSNFLLDRYHEDDHTLANFVRELRKEAPTLPSDLGELFRQCRIYLGNTLLCYRTGWSKKGETNLSRRSFNHCREHLARHVDALAPRVIVTFGREPARSIAHLVEGKTPAACGVLAELRREPRVKKHMESFYAAGSEQRGIPCSRHGRDVIHVPLCHPSMPNRYQGDYRGLARAIGLAPRVVVDGENK